MVVSLRTGKAQLSSLIARVERGEEVLIAIRGKPRARLMALPARDEEAMSAWADELQELHRGMSGKRNLPAATAISELRDR